MNSARPFIEFWSYRECVLGPYWLIINIAQLTLTAQSPSDSDSTVEWFYFINLLYIFLGLLLASLADDQIQWNIGN